MNRQDRLYVDIHVLQTVPPSCVNRDDTGSPKTAVYGGAVRARVSSQAWKRAVRLDFRENFDAEKVGLRTKKIVDMVARAILDMDTDIDEEKAKKLAQEALEKGGLKIKNSEKGTDALFFMSLSQAEAVAKLALEGKLEKKEEKKAYAAALKEAPSVDMALFGRMVASDPSLNYDAAAQVAHAISTHAVQTEYDYFTAVDDCAPEDSAGAGHLGTVEYNSSTLYRYATVNVPELLNSLKSTEETAAVVRAFARSFITAMPTGKQNTFANRTLPDAVYVAVRRDQPINLCVAFEQPISPGPNGYVEASVKKLADYARKLYETFADTPAWAFCTGCGLETLGETAPLGGMLDRLEKAVKECLSDCGVE
jgi:CRISPR system Cascade subunit CasC